MTVKRINKTKDDIEKEMVQKEIVKQQKSVK